MADRITTREAAIEEMLRWANGEKSHWNAYAASIGQASPEVIAAVTTECHRADAAEVQKWAAVAGTLASPATETLREGKLLRRCVALIGAFPETSFGPYGMEARELLRDLQRALTKAEPT